MMKNTTTIPLMFLLASIPLLAISENLYVYPAGGQSQEQLEHDRYDCYQWAVKSSGTDPSSLESPSASTVKVKVAKNPSKGNAAKGAVVGTVAGAVIGSTIESGGHHHRGGHNNTLGGAIIGATIGTLIGSSSEQKGRRETLENARDQASEKAREQEEAQKEHQRKLSDYNRAFSACMEARNYTVR